MAADITRTMSGSEVARYWAAFHTRLYLEVSFDCIQSLPFLTRPNVTIRLGDKNEIACRIMVMALVKELTRVGAARNAK